MKMRLLPIVEVGMEVVVNASPLILLGKIDRLHLLNELFDAIYIPDAVMQEIMATDKTKLELCHALHHHFVVSNQVAVLGLLGRLHIGEAEVMIGAIEKGIRNVVLDDGLARNKAKQLGLAVTGTLGILLRAHRNGLIDDLRAEIENLKRAGMYIADDIIAQIL